MNEKPVLIKLDPETGTDCKQASAGQQYRLSGRASFGMMRQSGLAGTEPQEGASKNLPASDELVSQVTATTRASSPAPQAESIIECPGNRALLNVPGDTLRYIAGFFDGEGCVMISRQKKVNTYCVFVRITSTNLETLSLLKELFGGSVFVQPLKNENASPAWGWVVCSKKANAFLKSVFPYLEIKREQAAMAIDFQLRLKRGDHHISEDEVAERELVKKKMSSVKNEVLRRINSDLSIPYLAGLFDAEGTVMVGVYNGTPCLSIRITGTDKILLDKIKELRGGSVCEKRDKHRIKRCWHWAVYASKAAALLKEMLPFLIVKRDQARLAVEFQEAGAGRAMGFTYKELISNLNRRTRAAKN